MTTNYKDRFERALNSYVEKYGKSREYFLYVLETKSHTEEGKNWSKELQASFVHLAVAYGLYMREKNGTL